jgi:hypothetical protein
VAAQPGACALDQAWECSPGQLFDRADGTGDLATVVTTSARTDRVVALVQQAPLPVTVDQDTALVEDSIQQKRSIGLYPLQGGEVNLTSADTLQAHGQVGEVRRSILGERDQHIHV